MICPNYKCTLPDEPSAFCPYCGTSLTALSGPAPATAAPTHNKHPQWLRTINIILLVFVLFLTGIGGYQGYHTFILHRDVLSYQRDLIQKQDAQKNNKALQENWSEQADSALSIYQTSVTAANFYGEYVAFISDNDSRYWHLPQCPTFNRNTPLQIWSVRKAMDKGYHQCPQCYSEEYGLYLFGTVGHYRTNISKWE